MNQRSLAVLTLAAPAAAITTNTNHTAVDLATYNAKREMKAHFGGILSSGTTSHAIKIQENPTTNASGSTEWSDITGASITALTTTGYATAIHFSTSKRYIRAVSTLAGTTLSSQPFGIVLVEQRHNP